MHHVALLILLQAILLPLSHAANATATPLPRFAGINLNQFQYSTSLDSADSNIGTGTYRLFWSLDSPSLRASFLPTTFKISPSTKLTRPNGGIFDLTIPNTTDTASILHVCLVLDITKARLLSGKGITNATQSSNVWAGIAFGDTMLDAQFVVANAFDTANITVKQFFINERTPIVAYGPPAIINFPGALGMVPGIGIIEQGYFIAEFRLLLTEVPDTASILWAFYAGSASSDGRVFGMFHNLNKGVEIIQFAKGAVLQSFTVSLFFNRLHACGMAASVFMFFVGIVYARFLRHRSEWLIVHIICQVLGIILQISFVLLMAVTLPKETQNGLGLDVNVHSVIGIVILTVLGVQTILGALACFSMRIEMMQKIRPVLRVLHRYTGHLFLTACLVQTFIGMNILFPFLATPPRGREVWGVFVTLWVLVMVGMIIWEVFYRLRYSNKSAMTRTKSTSWRNFLNFSWPFKKHTKIIDDMGTESKNGTFKVIGVDEYRREISPFDEKAMNKEQQQMEKAKSLLLSKTLEKQDNTENGLKKMTWEDIDESTRTGNLLVIANRQYVYSINEWISSHPGGQIILHSVAGTDITNDFFMESGFDARDIELSASYTLNGQDNLRKRARASQAIEKINNQPPQIQNYSPIATPTSISLSRQLSKKRTADTVIKKIPGLLDSEVKFLLQARRTHFHTLLAVDKLSKLLVGQLVIPPSAFTTGKRGFEPSEFRRYAMVSNVVQTTSNLTNLKINTGSASPVHKLKFCLLYPQVVGQEDEPTEFLPGQCIEIQMKIGNNSEKNSGWVSRYYTPLRGSTKCFEMLVKTVAGGLMSTFLNRQKPGTRQFRIRGPFGTPFFSVPRSPSSPMVIQIADKYVFITAGSGLTPALHMIEYLLLPTKTPLIVHTPYTAQSPDELTLTASDVVEVLEHFYDGWAYVRNLRTTEFGVIPLPVTYPRTVRTLSGGAVEGTLPQIVVLHGIRYTADAFGLQTLRGAALAYPGCVKIVHAVSNPGVAVEDTLSSPSAGDVRASVLRLRAAVAGDEGGEGDLIPGTHAVYTRRIDRDVVEEVVVGVAAWNANGEKTKGKVFVCGSKGFEGGVYETLVESEDEVEGLVQHDDVMMLPDDHFC